MAMLSIKGSVGKGGKNATKDVIVVQRLLNKYSAKAGFSKLAEDGQSGPKTVEAIKKFQTKVAGFKSGDGRVDPGQNTIKALNTGKAEGGESSGSAKVSGSIGPLDKDLVAYIEAVSAFYGVRLKILSGKRSASEQAEHMFKNWGELSNGWGIEYLVTNRPKLNKLAEAYAKANDSSKSSSDRKAAEDEFKELVRADADKISAHVRGTAVDLGPKTALNEKVRKALGLHLKERKDGKQHIHYEVPAGKKAPKVTDAVKAKWPKK